MEGFLQSVSPRDRKKQWQPLYVKLDDISATLVAFKDRAQVDVRWKMSIANADVASPVPGEPNHGINVDDTAYCFYVRNTTATSDDWHYFAAADDSNKKEWMKKLMQVARDGPHEARFASDRAESEYAFTARVDKFRVHDKGHAVSMCDIWQWCIADDVIGDQEYSIVCHCEIFSKLVARRMSKEWTVWHRFSEFEALDETLRKALGPEMKDIVFIKHTRDAFRTIFRTALDHTFLEQRRLQLDTYLKKVCENRRTVDFFKHHSNADLKAFFCFDENCENVVRFVGGTSK
ncbi:TPA: hypothetical protein N0F65_009068 [Lagenidium giganteum]|uniref:PH domain-containing protein n=1 Tax=Lagenidium giganteum TaxID=4803 RepID=A0AAV2YNX3_9STRA|nr:TPA: hypothetical protein N0F65_009068 [Lagenidium giganteum]